MRLRNFGFATAALLAFAVAMPAAAAEGDELTTLDAWQGQGQGQGQGRGNGNDRGNDRDRGNQGRADDDRGQAQGNQGRGNDDRGQAQGNQGRGNDDRGQAQGNRGRGNDGPAVRGNSGRDDDGRGVRRARPHRPDAARLRAEYDRLPDNVRRMSTSSRRGDRVVAGALARASLRGTSADRFRVVTSGDRWQLRNSRDELLLDMNEERARNLGSWEMRRLGDRRANENAPAFCRSGEGHPVWGREWCLDKGFGLGVSERSIWSRTTDSGVIFRRRPTADVIDRGGLIDVLGDVVFGRLAVQSLVLGYDQPLVGRWVPSNEPESPFVLRITAGDNAVAELVDNDRDDDVDVLFVSQPRW